MTPEDHARAAADLLDAERTHDQIGLLTLRHPEMGMDDAYEVQNAIYRAKLAEGRKVIGWKIGLTSVANDGFVRISRSATGSVMLSPPHAARAAMASDERTIRMRMTAPGHRVGTRSVVI